MPGKKTPQQCSGIIPFRLVHTLPAGGWISWGGPAQSCCCSVVSPGTEGEDSTLHGETDAVNEQAVTAGELVILLPPA
jgi:hypothetical protein